MNARGWLLGAALTATLLCSCAAPTPRATPSPPQEKDFEAAIVGIERLDPGSPAVLSAQLAYADFLLDGATGPCATRLERVQEQLGSVDASPKTRAMYPSGWGRLTDLEYRLHLARAACGSESDRANELSSAAAAARRAVGLYRNQFDYNSMVVMQYDASVALHDLGEDAAALAALQAAIDMDREYGFKDDASDNYALLLSWRGEPAGPAEVAKLMQDFPERHVMLKFAWHPSDARVAVETRRTCLNDGQILSSHAAATFERHVTLRDGGGWIVSYAHRLTEYQPGVWPTPQGSQTPPMVFTPAPLPADFNVSPAGDFAGVTDADAFASRLAAKVEALIRAAAPSGQRGRSLTSGAIETAAAVLSPGMLESTSAENYQLETAMWIHATLEQGVWYEISAPLSLPGIPSFLVDHRIEFAFTHMLPCTAGAAVQSCVEIVYRATPEQESLDGAIADIQSQLSQYARYTASIEARIVIDPATLMLYEKEAHVTWYVSTSNDAKDKVLQSEHLVSTVSYDRD